MRAPAGRILVVDDNRMNRLLLGRVLEDQGHTVAFAEDGQEALDRVRSEAFDLMLLDVVMPQVDGFDVLRAMKIEPRLRDLPVIVTSAVDEFDNVVKCIELGAEDYLTKPVNAVLLRARVTSSLEKKRLHDERRELISKFTTREVADDLLTSGFSLGGKAVDAAALFCDIRSFTSIAEAQTPAETIDLLNDYYTLMMDAIGGEGGIVNQMVGDGLMAIFGAPIPTLDFRLRAVNAARQMVELVDLFSGEQKMRGQDADQDRRRDRVRTRDRRLHRYAAPGHLHVRRRHGQPCRPARVAHEGHRPTNPHGRGDSERPRRCDPGRGARRADGRGQDPCRERLLGRRLFDQPTDRWSVEGSVVRSVLLPYAWREMQANRASLPGRDYHAPDVFELERERIFFRHWMYVARADEAPEPGDFVTVDVAGESIIVVRGRGRRAQRVLQRLPPSRVAAVRRRV